MTRPDLSVIIVNAGAYEDLANCLASVTRGTHMSYEAVVVDNIVDSSKVERLKSEFAVGVRWIPMESNIGFGAANNVGATQTEAPYLLFLNPDTIVPLGAIDELVAISRRYPGIGILGPTLLNEDGSVQTSAYMLDPSLIAMVLDVLGLPFVWRSLTSRRTSARPHHVLRRAAWIKGASLLLSRETWELLGGFDESLFMFGEDADLCRRARTAGLGVAVACTVSITHLGGTSYRDRVVRAQAIRNYYAAYEAVAMKRDGPGSRVWKRVVLRLAMRAAALTRCAFLTGTSLTSPPRLDAARAYWRYASSGQ